MVEVGDGGCMERNSVGFNDNDGDGAHLARVEVANKPDSRIRGGVLAPGLAKAGVLSCKLHSPMHPDGVHQES
jgi:hypothetical protein